MTLIELVSVAAIPVSIVGMTAALFVGVAFATKKNRLETIKALEARDFGSDHFAAIANIWANWFYRLFGETIFAKRQLITVPLYSLAVSGIFFSVWLIYLFIFSSPGSEFWNNLPLPFKQAVYDFYHEGIVATLLIDFITIQLTKLAIKIGMKRGYYSVGFLATFALTLISAYFIFSIAVFFFRVEDMVRLYMTHAPNDQIPVMPYSLFPIKPETLLLFTPPTTIHVTSNGWFTTYFMPEPLIFYCAVAVQLTLIATALSYQMATSINWVKGASIGLVKQVGTPVTNAYSVMVLVLLGLISVPVIALSIVAMLR